MNNPKVSVIIPVYNAEMYLEQCLDSVVNQTLKDIEIICVNDGSTDSSSEILQRYASGDSRILLINQENKGVAAARNRGLEVASGEYMMFLDGDDYYIETACQKAYDSIVSCGADIGIFGNYDLNNSDLRLGLTALKQKEIFASGYDNYFELQVYCWDKIYRADYLHQKNQKFVESLVTAEDIVFCLSLYFEHPKYCIINELLYVYRIHKDSCTHNSNCIEHDTAAFKVLREKTSFLAQDMSFQLQVVENFLSAAIGYLKISQNHRKDFSDAMLFIKYLEDWYSSAQLSNLPSYKYLKKYRFKYFLSQIFSLTNSFDKTYKIITILGIKVMCKRRRFA